MGKTNYGSFYSYNKAGGFIMAVYQGSRYVKTSAYVRRGETLVLSIRDRSYFSEASCSYYTVVQGDTVDGIAYKKYGNARLGWAIMDANPVYQSEIEIKAGDVIKIPPFESVVKLSE